MSYSEHFDYFYNGLHEKDFSTVNNMIQSYLWESYDDEKALIIDMSKFIIAYKLCKSAYIDLKEYEDQIEDDLKEINGEYGSPMFGYGDIPGIEAMDDICKTFHKYFEFFDPSELVDNNGNKTDVIQDISFATESTISPEKDPNHINWFVKVLSSKIKVDNNSNKELALYNGLNRLFDKLCEKDCLNPDKENRAVFIYRFSGFNGAFSPDIKIHWKGKNVFLGNIVRCLISDKKTDPIGLGKVASFFQSTSEKSINLSVGNNIVKDFEKEKNNLPSEFVKTVELLRECGFVNVEYTSARR